jgi:hypothetical protein
MCSQPSGIRVAGSNSGRAGRAFLTFGSVPVLIVSLSTLYLDAATSLRSEPDKRDPRKDQANSRIAAWDPEVEGSPGTRPK